MSEENVETYRRVIAAFNRGGDPQAQELFDPEVRIEPLLAGGVEGVVYRGRAGAREFVSQLNEIFAEVHADYSRIEEFDDVLLVSGKTTGRGRNRRRPRRAALVLRRQIPARQDPLRGVSPNPCRSPRSRRAVGVVLWTKSSGSALHGKQRLGLGATGPACPCQPRP